MPVEVEAKMRLNDPDRLEGALRALGVSDAEDIFEVNTYFDRMDDGLRKSDQGLRLRTERRGTGDAAKQTHIITHKGPRQAGHIKTRSETEVVVDDAGNARALLEALGYVPRLTFEKHRRRYRLDDCCVDVDLLPHIGRFVEVEGPNEASVDRVRARLGLADEPIIQPSYATMLAQHVAEHGLDPKSLTVDVGG